MSHGDNLDVVTLEAKEQHVREATQELRAVWPVGTPEVASERRFPDRVERDIDPGDQLDTEPRPLRLVPGRSFGQLLLCLGQDAQSPLPFSPLAPTPVYPHP